MSNQRLPASRRLPALDGLRAIAILLVISGHTFYENIQVDASVLALVAPLANADLGVTAFFVLSGYLITSILARERESSGTIRLRAFYRRRALRLWPALYFYLAFMGLLAAAGFVSISGTQFLSAALFVWNYSPAAGGWWLGALWTLAIEEQFYLVWPLILRIAGIRRALYLSLVGIALVPFIRVAEYLAFASPSHRAQMSNFFHIRADSLLTGCALALIPFVYPQAAEWIASLVARWRLELIAIALLIVSSYLAHVGRGGYLLPIGWTINNLSVAVIIVSLTSTTPRAVVRVLSWRPMVGIGLISYSLYLWNPLFTTRLNHTFTRIPPLNFALIFLVAFLSYRFIELPFLKLKERSASRSVGAEHQEMT